MNDSPSIASLGDLSSKARPATREKIGVVNGLRGLAVACVVYHHYFSYLTPSGTGAVSWGPFRVYPLCFLSNAIGASLFFVLSGFVLDLPFAQGRRSFQASGALKTFYFHRFRRLLPLFYFSTLLLEFLVQKPNMGTSRFWLDQLLLATVTFTFTPWTFMPEVNFVLWSLGIETWFGVAFPWLVRAIDRWSLRPVLFGALAVGLATRFVGVWMGPGSATVGSPHWIRDGLPGRIDDFVVGICVSRAYVGGLFRMTSAGRLALLLLGGVGVFLGCSLSDAIRLGVATPWLRPFVPNLLQLGFSSALVALLAARGQGIAAKVFSFSPLQLIGKMCYSIYIWHVPVWMALAENPGPKFARYVSHLLFLILLSVLSYRYIEFGREPDIRKLFSTRE